LGTASVVSLSILFQQLSDFIVGVIIHIPCDFDKYSKHIVKMAVRMKTLCAVVLGKYEDFLTIAISHALPTYR
jgi:hypothetical protein